MGVDKVHTLAKVNGPLYEGVLWASVGICMAFVTFRLWVRRQTLKKLLADDYLVLLALFNFVLLAALQQSQLVHVYELFALQAGEIMPSLSWMRGQTSMMHSLAGWNILFYTGLWAVKISFLVFFRHLDGGVSNLRRYWWWFVLFITLASWAVCIGDIQWECMIINLEKNFLRYTQCGMPEKVNFQLTTLIVNCTLDVITDLLIISVPVALLWNRQMQLRKKLVLIGLFSMTVLVMTIAIIRVALVASKNVPSDITWLYFWSDIELAIALLVSSLGSFRQLYISKQPDHASPRPSNYKSGQVPSMEQQRLAKAGSISTKTSGGSLTDVESLTSQDYRPVV